MKKKRFLKLVMSEGCDKRTAKLFSEFAKIVYGSYSTAYSNKGFEYIRIMVGVSDKTNSNCYTKSKEILDEIIKFYHKLSTIYSCDYCICDQGYCNDKSCLENIVKCVRGQMDTLTDFGSIKDPSTCTGEIEAPISKEKMDNCYISNGETYPLCKGQPGNNKCKDCNMYEDMAEPYDYV